MLRKLMMVAITVWLSILAFPAFAQYGGSCTPGLVNWHRQNPPNGAICERPYRRPMMQRYYQSNNYRSRTVYQRQPAYYPPRRVAPVVMERPCGGGCGIVAPAPCGTCRTGPTTGVAQLTATVGTCTLGPGPAHGIRGGEIGHVGEDRRCHF